MISLLFFSILADTQFKNAGHFCESIDSSHLLKAIWDLGRLNTFQRPFLGANVLNRCSRILAVWALEILDINTSNAKGVLLMGMFWSQKQAIAILLDVWKTSNSCDSCDPKCVYNFEGNLKGSVPWWAPLVYQQFHGNIGTIQPSNRPSACRASMGVAFLPYAGRCPVPSKYVTRFGLRSPPHMAAGFPLSRWDVRHAAVKRPGHFPRFRPSKRMNWWTCLAQTHKEFLFPKTN